MVLGLSVSEGVVAGDSVRVRVTVRVLLAVAVPVALLLRVCVPVPVGGADSVRVWDGVFVMVDVAVDFPVVDTVADEVPVDDVDGVESGVSVPLPVVVRVCVGVAVPVPEFVRVPLPVAVRVGVREPVTAALPVDVTAGVPVLDDEDVCVEVPEAAAVKVCVPLPVTALDGVRVSVAVPVVAWLPVCVPVPERLLVDVKLPVPLLDLVCVLEPVCVLAAVDVEVAVFVSVPVPVSDFDADGVPTGDATAVRDAEELCVPDNVPVVDGLLVAEAVFAEVTDWVAVRVRVSDAVTDSVLLLEIEFVSDAVDAAVEVADVDDDLVTAPDRLRVRVGEPVTAAVGAALLEAVPELDAVRAPVIDAVELQAQAVAQEEGENAESGIERYENTEPVLCAASGGARACVRGGRHGARQYARCRHRKTEGHRGGRRCGRAVSLRCRHRRRARLRRS